jgi:hypothetical protein
MIVTLIYTKVQLKVMFAASGFGFGFEFASSQFLHKSA